MDVFTKLFGDFLVFVYHCFDRIVIHGYLTALSRPELVVHFFRDIVGVAEVSKEALSQRTADYQRWVEAYARNHPIPIEWAEKGVRMLPDFAAFPAGSHEAPEYSATLILQVAAWDPALDIACPARGCGSRACWRATDCRKILPHLAANHALYPRGVDIILCAGTTLTALPRSVSIEEA